MYLRTLFLLVFSIFITLSSSAQSEYNFFHYGDIYYNQYFPVKHSVPDDIKQITFVQTNKKGKKTTTVKNFDAKGKLLDVYHQSDKKSVLQPFYKYEYDKNNKVKK